VDKSQKGKHYYLDEISFLLKCVNRLAPESNLKTHSQFDVSAIRIHELIISCTIFAAENSLKSAMDLFHYE
jgi:hypothetical protein